MPTTTLRTHSPTPSTTAYTVTTLPLQRSRLSHLLLRYLILPLRVLLGILCAVVLVLHIWDFTAARNEWEAGGAGVRGWLAGGWRRSEVVGYWDDVSLGIREKAGDRWGVWGPIGVCVMVLWGLSRRGYVEESLLALRSLGLQTSTSSRSIFSTPTTRFIPTSQIQDIFIHEAFIGFSVKFYLAVIVEGEEEAVVVFPKLLPKREALEEVWRGARSVLWGPNGKEKAKEMDGAKAHPG